MKQPVEFFAPSSRDPDNRWANSARLINCYREPAGDGRVSIKSVLGITAFADTESVFCRAAAEVDGTLYVVQGRTFYSINSAGDVTDIGDVEDDGGVTISGNNGDVTVVAGGKYYVWNGSTLSEPSAGAFSDFGSVTFFGQLTVLTERNGRRVQWSNVADASSLGGLDFATTESRDDDNLRALPVNGELWFFKEASIERWYQQGAGLAAIPGGTLDLGLKSFRLLAPIATGGAFFIATDGKAYLAPDMQAISTVPVETSIASQNPAECYYYEDEGHKFCVIRFPDRPAWVFDLSTGEWHERAESELLSPWAVQAAAKAYGHWHGVKITGEVVRFARTNQDAGGVLVRRAVGRTVQQAGERFRVSEFQIQGRFGHSSSGPKITLRVSDDFGQTFLDGEEFDLGDIGEQDGRLIWRSLGSFYQFTPELTWTDSYDFNFDSQVFLRVT